MGFRFVRESMTLNDPEWSNRIYIIIGIQQVIRSRRNVRLILSQIDYTNVIKTFYLVQIKLWLFQSANCNLRIRQ